MTKKDELRQEASRLGVDVDERWNEATLQRKINEKMAELGEMPDEQAERKNRTGQTNPEDLTKNKGEPGPGNPEALVIDPKTLTDAEPVNERREVVADTPFDDEGNKLSTEETPKVIHETRSAASREITNNTLADMSDRDPLVIQAQTMGIYVDPSWSRDRLRREIHMAGLGRADLQVKGAIPNETFDAPTVGDVSAGGTPVSLTRDYWDEDGTRHAAGTLIHLPSKEARRLINSGVASREDKLPGE